jgi:hypothetical protein
MYVFALGTETHNYMLNGEQVGEFMPNVEVYPNDQSTPTGYGTYNFPIEYTPQTGVWGVAIASRPVSSSALAVYGVVTNGGGAQYDSFATVWNPALGLLGISPTVYHHGTSWPTLVAADVNYAYFAGAGILYEHNASTFALNGSLSASGGADLEALFGNVYLVGGNSLTCYTP